MASSRILSIFQSLSSAVLMEGVSMMEGIPGGVIPMMISKGDCCLSAWGLELWTYSRIGRCCAQVEGFCEQ